MVQDDNNEFEVNNNRLSIVSSSSIIVTSNTTENPECWKKSTSITTRSLNKPKSGVTKSFTTKPTFTTNSTTNQYDTKRNTKSLATKHHQSITFNSKLKMATHLHSHQSILSKKKHSSRGEIQFFPGPVNCQFMAGDWGAVLKKWGSQGSTRFDMIFFVNLSGVSPFHATFNDRLFLSRFLLNKVNFRPSNSSKMVPIFHFHKEAIQRLRSRAIQAYFHYNHPFFAPFTRSLYDTKPRSQLLHLTVWRVGMTFLSSTPFHDQISLYLDEQILKSTNLSQLRYSLDTIQALLILIQGVFRPPLFNRIRSFLYMIDTITSSLGLLQLNYQSLSLLEGLELHLTLNLLNSCDHRQFFRTDQYYFVPLPNDYFKLFSISQSYSKFSGSNSKQLYSSYLRYLNTKLMGNNNGSSLPSITPTVNGSIVAGDLGLIIASSCISNFINDSKCLHSIFTLTQIEASSIELLETTLKNTISQLQTNFLEGFSHLHSLKIIQHPTDEASIQFTTELPSSRTSLFTIYNCPLENLRLSQSQCFLAMHFHYFSLQCLDYASYLPLKSTELKLRIRPKYRYSKFSARGLLSAIKLIQLFPHLSYGPFNTMRIYMLLKACRFIISHFTVFSNLTTLQLQDTILRNYNTIPNLTDTLLSSLQLARSHLHHARSLAKFKYFYAVSITLLDALLKRSNIQLPINNRK